MQGQKWDSIQSFSDVIAAQKDMDGEIPLLALYNIAVQYQFLRNYTAESTALQQLYKVNLKC